MPVSYDAVVFDQFSCKSKVGISVEEHGVATSESGVVANVNKRLGLSSGETGTQGEVF